MQIFNNRLHLLPYTLIISRGIHRQWFSTSGSVIYHQNNSGTEIINNCNLSLEHFEMHCFLTTALRRGIFKNNKKKTSGESRSITGAGFPVIYKRSVLQDNVIFLLLDFA